MYFHHPEQTPAAAASLLKGVCIGSSCIWAKQCGRFAGPKCLVKSPCHLLTGAEAIIYHRQAPPHQRQRRGQRLGACRWQTPACERCSRPTRFAVEFGSAREVDECSGRPQRWSAAAGAGIGSRASAAAGNGGKKADAACDSRAGHRCHAGSSCRRQSTAAQVPARPCSRSSCAARACDRL